MLSSDDSDDAASPREELALLWARGLWDNLMPRLLGRVFHVAPLCRLARIRESGVIKGNVGGELGFNHPQSRNAVGTLRGIPSFFDLRDKPEQWVHCGISVPAQMSQMHDLAIFFVAPAYYGEFIQWEDFSPRPEIGETHVPHVECWYPRDFPIVQCESVLVVSVLRLPIDPASHLGILAAVAEAERRERGQAEPVSCSCVSFGIGDVGRRP